MKIELKILVLLLDNFTTFALTLVTKYNPSFGGILFSTVCPSDNPVTIYPTSPANKDEFTFTPTFLFPNESKNS